MKTFKKDIEYTNNTLLDGHIQINIENVKSLTAAKTEIEDMLQETKKSVKTEYISDNEQE